MLCISMFFRLTRITQAAGLAYLLEHSLSAFLWCLEVEQHCDHALGWLGAKVLWIKGIHVAAEGSSGIKQVALEYMQSLLPL